jgi:hypothetical protein
MNRAGRLLSRREELRALRLARNYPEEATELADLIGEIRRRVIASVSSAPEVQEMLGERRHRFLGAELHVEEPGRPLAPLPRHAEVSIYDYDRDTLIAVVVDLKTSEIVAINEFPGLQPFPSQEEEREARELAADFAPIAGSLQGRRARAVVLLAHENAIEDHPSFGHRAMQVTFWTGGRRPERIAGPVVADLTRRDVYPSIGADEES